MKFESDKTMFEIYREHEYNREFRVILYTELNESNKHSERNRTLDGETIFSGFLNDDFKSEAKIKIREILTEMNTNDEPLPESEIRDRLKKYLI